METTVTDCCARCHRSVQVYFWSRSNFIPRLALVLGNFYPVKKIVFADGCGMVWYQYHGDGGVVSYHHHATIVVWHQGVRMVPYHTTSSGRGLKNNRKNNRNGVT